VQKFDSKVSSSFINNTCTWGGNTILPNPFVSFVIAKFAEDTLIEARDTRFRIINFYRPICEWSNYRGRGAKSEHLASRASREGKLWGIRLSKNTTSIRDLIRWWCIQRKTAKFFCLLFAATRVYSLLKFLRVILRFAIYSYFILLWNLFLKETIHATII